LIARRRRRRAEIRSPASQDRLAGKNSLGTQTPKTLFLFACLFWGKPGKLFKVKLSTC